MSIETLRPNAAGDETNIWGQYPGEEGEHWDKVDEETQDGNTTFLTTMSTDGERDLYNLANPSGSGTINWIKVHGIFRLHATSGTAYLTPAIKMGGTAYEGVEASSDVSWDWIDGSHQWTTNPYTESAWTWDDLTSLQAGIKLRMSSSDKVIRCTQVYVEVDYTAGATEKTSSDAGSGVDALYSLEKGEVKTSSDAGSGVEGTSVQSAILAGSEAGSGIEALIARLLAAVDTGSGIEASSIEIDGLLKDLFASELGRGSDSLAVKIEMPIKGGGMKLWM